MSRRPKAGAYVERLPAVGTRLDCGCTVRLLSARPCPKCGAPPFGDSVGRMPVSAAPGTTTTLDACCWSCGHEWSVVARVLA